MPGLTRTAIVERRFRGDRARAEAYFSRFGAALEPEDIAASVLFAVRQPPHVTVAQLLVIPSSRY